MDPDLFAYYYDSDREDSDIDDSDSGYDSDESLAAPDVIKDSRLL